MSNPWAMLHSRAVAPLSASGEGMVSQYWQSVPNIPNVMQWISISRGTGRRMGAAHRDVQLALEPFGRPLHRECAALGRVSERQVSHRRHAAYLHAPVAGMLQCVQDWPVDAPGHLSYGVQRGIHLWGDL